MTVTISSGRRRGAAAVAAMALMAACLAGCSSGDESVEDFVERLASDPDVDDVMASSRSIRDEYEIRLEDEARSGICDVTERIRTMVEARGDRTDSVRIVLGEWEWAVDVDAETSARICGLAGDLLELDAAFGGTVFAGSGVGVNVIADAGEDLPDLFESVSRILADHRVDDPYDTPDVYAYDVTGRFQIYTRDAASDAAETLAAIREATSAGAMTSYQAETTGLSSFWARTDADGAAITAALASAGLSRGRSVTGSGVHIERGADEEAARHVWALVEPLDGVRDSRASGDTISVQTSDVDTAIAVQSLLATAPEIQPYATLGISVDLTDGFGLSRTNWDRRLLTVWSAPDDLVPFTQTLSLTQVDGVVSVDSSDDELKVELEPSVDPTDLAADIRAASRTGQKVVVFTQPFADRLLVFTHVGLLLDREVSGAADRKAFIEAWNEAAE